MATANSYPARASWRRSANHRTLARSDARPDRSRAKRRGEIRRNNLQRAALLARAPNRRRAKSAAVRARFVHVAPIADRLLGLIVDLRALKYFFLATTGACRHCG